MTRQGDVREEIINWFLMRNPTQTRSWAEQETKMLFIKQDSLGVVIKVKGKRPIRQWDEMKSTRKDNTWVSMVTIANRIISEMGSQGYVAVEPLLDAPEGEV